MPLPDQSESVHWYRVRCAECNITAEAVPGALPGGPALCEHSSATYEYTPLALDQEQHG